jgi:cytochrome c-type biogenesis protein CcmF
LIRILGHAASVVALLLVLGGAPLAFVAGARRDARLGRLAGRLTYAVWALVVLSAVAMIYALVTHDFSVSYVAHVGSRSTPLFFTIISLWSALEGSILLWAFILISYTVAVAIWARREANEGQLAWYTLGVLFCVNAFFLLLIAWPANPFRLMSPVPADGPGPNALLQNNSFMAVHPPLLYTGYAGMAVPFAMAMAALIAGRLERSWTNSLRRWTLIPWSFLTLGITAGMWWSYEVLGWGGYWAWDPVENASFMPWLTATAFLHSLMVHERRGMLKVWTLVLIVSTFLLTILGTFLTRSGVVASVHAFTASLIGPIFLIFLGLVLLASLALLGWRGDLMKTEGNLDSLVSRETAFMFNNLLFGTFTFVVLLGTLFPLIAEAASGAKVSVGAPFFNRMTMPLALALVFLAGVGPALPWGSGTVRGMLRKMSWPIAAALIGGAVAVALGLHPALAVATFSFVVLALALLVGEFVLPTRARHASGESIPRAFSAVVLSNRRRYGGYIVHAGVLTAVLGVAVSTPMKHDKEWTLKPGQTAQFGRYDIRLDSVNVLQEPQRDGVISTLTVNRDGKYFDTMLPRLNFYRTAMEPIGSPAVNWSVKEDLYLVLLAFAEDGSTATIHAIATPYVTLIWIGGIIMGLGGFFAFWPKKKRIERAVPVRARAPAPAGSRTGRARSGRR